MNFQSWLSQLYVYPGRCSDLLSLYLRYANDDDLYHKTFSVFAEFRDVFRFEKGSDKFATLISSNSEPSERLEFLGKFSKFGNYVINEEWKCVLWEKFPCHH